MNLESSFAYLDRFCSISSSVCRDNESRGKHAQKQVDIVMKQKKFALGKMLSVKIIPSNIQSLKFPIGNMTQVETNPIEAVKNLVAGNKSTGIKLFRKKKHGK
jgi:hypothetical protein